jgi:hypothetical protein
MKQAQARFIIIAYFYSAAFFAFATISGGTA